MLSEESKMKTQILKLVLTAALFISVHNVAQAAKYDLCITCTGGGPYKVGSPTPNPGGSFLTAFCASKGAGTPVSMSLAQKVLGKNRCIGKPVKIDGIKKL
jgi:hypothetical protein